MRYWCIDKAGIAGIAVVELLGGKLPDDRGRILADTWTCCSESTAGAPAVAAGEASLPLAVGAASACLVLRDVVAAPCCRRLSSSCVLCCREGSCSWSGLGLPTGSTGCRPATCLMSESSNCSSDCRLAKCLDFSCLETQGTSLCTNSNYISMPHTDRIKSNTLREACQCMSRYGALSNLE